MRSQVVFDTNILIYFFDGNAKAAKLLETTEFFLSSMTHVEILSDLNTSKQKRELIKDFLSAITIIQTSPIICEKAAKLRLSYAIKLPDAIIAATASYLGLPLITGDAEFFKIKEVEIIPFTK
jgi:predicted nucleic acid-binding protein